MPSKLRQMLRDRMNREQVYNTAGYWDGKAEQFAGNSVSMWPNEILNEYYQRERQAAIENYLTDVEGLWVLDVGCGTGRISRLIAGRGARVVGFDFAAKAVEIATRETAGENPTYRVQSVFDLDEVSTYDVAVSWGTLTIACRTEAELLDALGRLRRALKPGGRILLLEPIHRGLLHRVLDMSVRRFVSTMGEAGFEVKDVTHLHFWPARLLLAYVPLPRWVTGPAYHTGQWLMRLIRNRALGDYQAIYAIANRPVRLEQDRPSSPPAPSAPGTR